MRLRVHRAAMVLVMVLTAAPAIALALQASASQQVAADGYFDCLVQNAQQADDGVSQPSAVAARIEPACIDQEGVERARFRSTLDPRSVARFDRLWPGVRISTALKAVLVVRAGEAPLSSPPEPRQ